MGEKKILVVDDNAVNRELTLELLDLEGYIVLEAGTAEEGLELARSNSPDLILMDVSLPGLDGLSAARILRQDPATRDIPVVALTAHATQSDKDEALAAGCAGFVTKPIDLDAFLETVAHFVKT